MTSKNDTPEMPCTCRLCLYDREENISALTGEPDFMVVCPICGNKRCPHATNHKLPCTNSNETNQEGSWFADVVDAETEQARQKYLEKISYRTALSPKPEMPKDNLWIWEGGKWFNKHEDVPFGVSIEYIAKDNVKELIRLAELTYHSYNIDEYYEQWLEKYNRLRQECGLEPHKGFLTRKTLHDE